MFFARHTPRAAAERGGLKEANKHHTPLLQQPGSLHFLCLMSDFLPKEKRNKSTGTEGHRYSVLPAKEADWILAVCLTALAVLQVYSPVPSAHQQPCLTLVLCELHNSSLGTQEKIGCWEWQQNLSEAFPNLRSYVFLNFPFTCRN